MDECDSAERTIEQELTRNLAKRKHQLQAVGFCFNCNEPIRDGLLFCDIECHHDFERVEAANKRNGV